MIRVLVATDEPLIGAGIRRALESHSDIVVVAEAETGPATVDAATRHDADVLLIDVTVAVLDGLNAIEQLRRRLPALRVVVLTSVGGEPDGLGAVAGDVAGFVPKSCGPDELIRAVRAAHDDTRGGRP
jgi:DNA-binding NarL/FixJ family response regulator